MTNEEFLTAFEEFLQVDPVCRFLTSRFNPPSMLAIVRELAEAVDPFPLEEVTEQEIKVFLHDNRPTIPARPFGVNKPLARAMKLRAELPFYKYKAAMVCFRQFLSVLREHRPRR
jgi:hypothetical protein